jgi:D-tyrosyl-tRNA(Tyr) deacylase
MISERRACRYSARSRDADDALSASPSGACETAGAVRASPSPADRDYKAVVRAVVHRVSEARVAVDGAVVGEIGRGLCVLLGVGARDTEAEADALCRKVVALRIFDDQAGRFAHGLDEVGGGLLVVSQFTLYGDCRKGRRPSFTDAATPERARALYEAFVARARDRVPGVATGRFGARMALSVVNDGPVTLILDTAEGA